MKWRIKKINEKLFDDKVNSIEIRVRYRYETFNIWHRGFGKDLNNKIYMFKYLEDEYTDKMLQEELDELDQIARL